MIMENRTKKTIIFPISYIAFKNKKEFLYQNTSFRLNLEVSNIIFFEEHVCISKNSVHLSNGFRYCFFPSLLFDSL